LKLPFSRASARVDAQPGIERHKEETVQLKGGKVGLVTLVALVITLIGAGSGFAKLAPIEGLGEYLYFDTALSHPDGQSCASCHEPTVGFADPDADLPVSEGVVPGLFGGRNSPISAYAMYAPPFHFDDVEGLYIGGQFWDGRATGDVLGDPLADQAVGPPLNPVEMANPDKETVLGDILNGPYADLFIEVCGDGSLTDPSYVEDAYDCMGLSIGLYERTSLFAQFNSRYDVYLRRCLNQGGDPDACAQGTDPNSESARRRILDDQEWWGLQLFMAENDNDGVLEPGEGGFCAACHVANFVDPAMYENPVVVPPWSRGLIPPLFTDFSYDNLGVPKSAHPLLVNNPVDLGLGGVLGDEEEYGKFKVMTLRNIGASAPYLHNGLFSDLQQVVHFYNTRDDGTWPAPEYPDTVNFDELGNLGLGPDEEAAITAFMLTLTDPRYNP
jgi:cytochrome c peroxidase